MMLVSLKEEVLISPLLGGVPEAGWVSIVNS